MRCRARLASTTLDGMAPQMPTLKSRIKRRRAAVDILIMRVYQRSKILVCRRLWLELVQEDGMGEFALGRCCVMVQACEG